MQTENKLNEFGVSILRTEGRKAFCMCKCGSASALGIVTMNRTSQRSQNGAKVSEAGR